MLLSSTTVLVPSRDEIDNHGQADLLNLNQEAPCHKSCHSLRCRELTHTHQPCNLLGENSSSLSLLLKKNQSKILKSRETEFS